MTVPHPRIAPLGDAALTITWSDTIGPEVEALVRQALSALRGQLGLDVELVPGYTTITAHYRTADWTYPSLRDALTPALSHPGEIAASEEGRLIEIPVRYDGPDLESVAVQAGLTVREVVACHTATEYRVALLGFVPGWAYLGQLDPALVLPRRTTPRPRVPAGSVAIAGAQTGVYPAETPGGWHLIGRTTALMFDPTRTPPALLAVGDRVRFVAEV